MSPKKPSIIVITTTRPCTGSAREPPPLWGHLPSWYTSKPSTSVFFAMCHCRIIFRGARMWWLYATCGTRWFLHWPWPCQGGGAIWRYCIIYQTQGWTLGALAWLLSKNCHRPLPWGRRGSGPLPPSLWSSILQWAYCPLRLGHQVCNSFWNHLIGGTEVCRLGDCWPTFKHVWPNRFLTSASTTFLQVGWSCKELCQASRGVYCGGHSQLWSPHSFDGSADGDC